MIYALLTALCWSFAGFGSSRIARHFGSAPANGLRLFFSAILLALLALARSELRNVPGMALFALGGMMHLTLGDIALFAAYRRLGPRLGVLIVASLAPPAAMAVEWIALGTTLQMDQLLCTLAILCSVGFAVAPRERMHLTAPELRIGIITGIVAALGQGVGLAINRMAYARVATAGLEISPILPALLRVSAAALGVWLWIAFRHMAGHSPLRRPDELIPHKRVEGHPWLWMAVSTLLGPVAGMLFLMKASETAPSVLVQATLATLPVFMMPVAWWLDGNAPSKRSAAAGLVAVALTLLLIRIS